MINTRLFYVKTRTCKECVITFDVHYHAKCRTFWYPHSWVYPIFGNTQNNFTWLVIRLDAPRVEKLHAIKPTHDSQLFPNNFPWLVIRLDAPRVEKLHHQTHSWFATLRASFMAHHKHFIISTRLGIGVVCDYTRPMKACFFFFPQSNCLAHVLASLCLVDVDSTPYIYSTHYLFFFLNISHSHCPCSWLTTYLV